MIQIAEAISNYCNGTTKPSLNTNRSYDEAQPLDQTDTRAGWPIYTLILSRQKSDGNAEQKAFLFMITSEKQQRGDM
eukprot:scaffold18109_cov54-Attheya_sp.AAC.4